MKNLIGLFLLLVGTGSMPDHSEELVKIKVKITNIENEDSNLMVAVFKSHDTFLTDDMYRQEVLAVQNFTETEVEFELEKGEYAIAAFQDKNKNGDLDRNFFYYPTEPFGFSNNYRPIVKPPQWTDVSFIVDSNSTIELKLD